MTQRPLSEKVNSIRLTRWQNRGGEHAVLQEGEETPCKRPRFTLTSNYAVLLLLGVLPAASRSSRLDSLFLLSVRLSVILGNRIRSLLPAVCFADELLAVSGVSADVRRGEGIPDPVRPSRVVLSG